MNCNLTTNPNVNLLKNNLLISKFFSIFLALYPVLCIYKAFSSFTIGDVILICFFLFSLKKSLKIDSRFCLSLIFAVYIIIVFVINYMFTSSEYLNNNFFSVLLRIIKFIFYISSVFICTKDFFDYKIFKKTLIILASFSFLFIFLQYIVYFIFGEIIIGQIPFLPLHLDEYSKIDYNLIYSNTFRPSSIYLEPSIMSQVLILPLGIILYDKNDLSKFKRFLFILLCSIGIVLTKSAQGVLYLAITFCFYICFFIKNKIKSFLFFILLILCFLFLFFYVDSFHFAVNRLLTDKYASSARLDSFDYCFSLNGLYMIFGYGYGTTPNNVYMTGAAYVWFGSGIIGLLLIISLFILFFIKSKNLLGKNLCLLFFVMFFGTSLFYNYMLFWYFSIILVVSKINTNFFKSKGLLRC